MPLTPNIAVITTLPNGMQALQAEAAREGFDFVTRLISDWHSGANRFGAPDECLIGTFDGDRLIAVGGLNVDPYLALADHGRLRHLYLSPAFRRQGVGALMVERLLAHAKGRFRIVRLRTDTPAASDFYAKCGFSPVDDATASHVMAI